MGALHREERRGGFGAAEVPWQAHGLECGHTGHGQPGDETAVEAAMARSEAPSSRAGAAQSFVAAAADSGMSRFHRTFFQTSPG